jgi:hypothetical protein
MGWCSATEIMDVAIAGAEATVKRVLDDLGFPIEQMDQSHLDNHIRPMVAKLAEQLNEDDWDCHSESDYYERFPQEMRGWDNEQYMDHLTEELADEVRHEGVTDRYRQLVARIERHNEKTRMEKNANGG